MLISYSTVYKRKHEIKEPDYNAPVAVLRQSSVDFEGKKVSSSEFIEDIPNDRFTGLSAVDFALENQLAVGVSKSAQFYSCVTNNECEQKIMNNE